MTRTISKSMSVILQELELENASYVDIRRLDELKNKYGIKTSAAIIASRLRQAGWLIPTKQRGVWEFAPASLAGAYSSHDPLTSIKAYIMSNPDDECYLCLQTAAWSLGLADRIPSHIEVAFREKTQKSIPDDITVFRYTPHLNTIEAKGLRCLSPESIIVQIAEKPSIVRSWDSLMEWLPDVVYESNTENIVKELSGRKDSVVRRTGYLLQGMYPDAADAVYDIASGRSKIRFGSRQTAIRNDEKWMISDTVLPFSPKELETVK